jgi:hypothetical protein
MVLWMASPLAPKVARILQQLAVENFLGPAEPL